MGSIEQQVAPIEQEEQLMLEEHTIGPREKLRNELAASLTKTKSIRQKIKQLTGESMLNCQHPRTRIVKQNIQVDNTSIMWDEKVCMTCKRIMATRSMSHSLAKWHNV